MADIEDIKEHYADLLIMQYHSKYKARETVKLGAEIYLGDGIVLDLLDVLNIDTAEGVQLDLIGKILDCPRIIPTELVDVEFFSFQKENALGFSEVGRLSTGYFKDIAFDYRSTYSMLDDDYRQLLRFKARANRARASWAELDQLFYEIFGDIVTIVNNKDLSITYNIINSKVNQVVKACLALNYFEPPLGISYNINYV